MILKRDFNYTPKGKNRPLHIYLPEGYEESTERYPVVYFFDGHNLFFDEETTYGKSWGLKEYLDQWNKPIIIVGIQCGMEGEERLSEYLPYPADADSRFAQFEPMGDATLKWIIEEIKPVIDRDFRTWPFRECTAIAGSSMGGIMALYGAVHYNQWISKAACVSTAMGFCMSPLMKDMTEQYMNPDTRIYLSWGTNEAWGLQDTEHEDTTSMTYWNNKAVADKVIAHNARVKMECQVGGYHSEASWEKLIPSFMNFLWLED